MKNAQIRFATAVALGVALLSGASACKRRDPVPDEAPRPTLEPGAVMAYSHGGGITGATSHVTVFADGRVERRGKAPRARVPAPRVQKLTADLAATGVFAVKDGSWAPSTPRPDSFDARLVVRDQAGGVHVYDHSGGASAPDAVVRAMAVGTAFEREAERDNPTPPCACQVGDPLCSCL